MSILFRAFIQLCRNAQRFLEQTKMNHTLENKTHEKLTLKVLFDITLPVTKVTAFETSEGIGEQSGDILGESNSRAVCSCY